MKPNILVLLFCYFESIVWGCNSRIFSPVQWNKKMRTPETEGLRIPWKFKSLPKEKALAMTRAMGANVGRYGSDVRSRYLNARRGIQTGHERHLFRNSYRDGKFLFKRRFGFRWSYPNIIRRRYSPNVSLNQGSAVVSAIIDFQTAEDSWLFHNFKF